MKTDTNRTISFTERDIVRNWVVVDAGGQTLGRVATRVATMLLGKHKPQFTQHTDVGDFVVVINAGKVKLTGKRAAQKEYYRNTGYPGGARFTKFSTAVEDRPEFVIEHAVKGMLPKTALGAKMIKKLKVYGGADHPHTAQTTAPSTH